MGIETALLLAAVAASAGSAIMQGQQARQTAETNAELARRQGEADKDAAIAQAEKIRKAARTQAGEANASLAASGVSIDQGTPVRINEQIYRNSESDAFSTILSGTRSARNANDQAGILQSQGRSAQTAGFLNAGASVLSAGSKIGGGWTSAASASPIGTGLKAPTTGFWGK